MKVLLKASLVTGVSILLLVLLVSIVSGAPTPGTNYVQTHAESSDMQNSECVACHNTLTENSRDTEGGNLIGAHRRHFLSIFLNFVNVYSLNETMTAANDPILYGCVHCHGQTVYKGMGTRNAWTGGTGYGLGFGNGFEDDLSYDSANGTGTPTAGRQVDPAVCVFCHGEIAQGPAHIAANVDSDTYCGGEGGSTCHWSGVWSPQVQHDPSVIGNTGVFIDGRYTNSMTYCNLCHGGPYVWFQEAQGIGIPCSVGLCHETLPDPTGAGPPQTHMYSAKGPKMAPNVTLDDNPCEFCHEPGSSIGMHAGHRNGILNFKEGPTVELAATNVCDSCHSPGGGYNGVDSVGDSVGAKNWYNAGGVYADSSTLSPGNENWCIGCHDDAPSIISSPATSDTSMTAAGAGGDGSTYGNNISGHGVSSTTLYDGDAIFNTAGGNPGAGKECVDCHDLTLNHLDNQDGSGLTTQRLSGTINSISVSTVFEVCTACHQQPGGTSTSTTQVSTHGNESTEGYTSIEQPFTIECQTCHELHGNNLAGSQRNLKMVRSSINSTEIVFSQTTGENSFDQNVGDSSDSDDICVTCHIITLNNPGYPMVDHAGGDHAIAGDQRDTDCTTCHGHEYKLNGVVDPANGFMPIGCSDCHTYPPGGTQGTYQGSQTHSMHYTTYGFTCFECHADFPVGHNQSLVNSSSNWAAMFDPVFVDVVFSTETNPFGTSSIKTTGADRNRQCENLYCHGQFGNVENTFFTPGASTNVVDFGGISTGPAALGVPDLFPAWNDLPTWDDGDSESTGTYDNTRMTGACGTCHDNFRDNNQYPLPSEAIFSDESFSFPIMWPSFDETTGVGLNDWSSQLTDSPISDAKIWDVTTGTSVGTWFETKFGWEGYKTHLDTLRGPRLTCYPCHPIPPSVGGFNALDSILHVDKNVDFISDVASGDTTRNLVAHQVGGSGAICGTICHSAEGAFDGVDDPSIGAIENWPETILDELTITTSTVDAPSFKAGKEKWCLGCHDSAQTAIPGYPDRPPPNIAGDDSQNLFGFYVTGHGSTQTYDGDSYGDTTNGNSGAGKDCLDCHDDRKPHLDGGDGTAVVDLRLREEIDGISIVVGGQLFAVCKACHQSSGPEESSIKVSSHGNETSGSYSPLEEPFVVQCTECHSPHGNETNTVDLPNLRMIRGSIWDNNIVFLNTTGTDSFDESDTVGVDNSDDICAACHEVSNPLLNPGYDTTSHVGGEDHVFVGDQRENDCTSCHSHDYKSDGVVAINDGFMPSCDSCHTYPPLTDQGVSPTSYQNSKTHERHIVTYDFDCVECHAGSEALTGIGTHPESGSGVTKENWQLTFDPAMVDLSFSNSLNASAYTSTSSAGIGLTNRQCNELYCHGQVSSDTLSIAEWADGTTRTVTFKELGGTNISSNIPTWDNPYAASTYQYSTTFLTGACGTCHETAQDNSSLGALFPIWSATPAAGESTSANDWSSVTDWTTTTTAPLVWDITSNISLGSTSIVPLEFSEKPSNTAHRTHLDEVRGPMVVCNACHTTPPTVNGGSGATPSKHVNGEINLKDDTLILSNTTVCDDCHSSGGTFDGVAIAKQYFRTGVYTTDTVPFESDLTGATRDWCLGCHDEQPPTIRGNFVSENMGGDNAIYGFNINGHGLDSGSSYDGDSYGDATGNQGADQQCTNCHDTKKSHIDGVDGDETSELRFRDTINSQPINAGNDLSDVCKTCHQNDGPDESSLRVSSHGNETSGTYSPLEEDFQVECWECHSPHGNEINTVGVPNLRMLKGNIWGNDIVFSNTTGTDSFDESDTVGAENSDDICATCHEIAGGMALHVGGEEHVAAGVGDQRENNCMLCHSHDYKLDGNVEPNDGFMPIACDECHSYPPLTSTGTYEPSKTHATHIVDYNYECSECHNLSAATHNQSGVTSAANWSMKFDPDNVDVVFDSTNPGGLTAVATVTVGLEEDRNRQCLNLYCHGQVDETITVGLWADGQTRDITFDDLGGTNKTFNIVETSISIPGTAEFFSFSANTIPTWDNPNNSGLANRFEGTYLSGSCGTCHDTVKDNTSNGPLYPAWQSAPGTSTTANDWSMATDWTTVTVPPDVWDITPLSSIGSTENVPPGSALLPNIAHRYHLDEIQGPMVVCNACHTTPPTVIGGSTATVSEHVNRQIDFTDGATSLDTSSTVGTMVCEKCHPTSGTYNGVNMAKEYFRTGVYNQEVTTETFYEEELPDVTERWCVTCHNNATTQTIRGVGAPEVGGDGSTYGFFDSGHGRNNLVQCHDCHDTKETPHIDQDSRTYTFTGASPTGSDYQAGYRLKLFNGGSIPLIVPKTGSVNTATDYKMCISCHNFNNIVGNIASQTTNFRSDLSTTYFFFPQFRFSDQFVASGPTNNHKEMTTLMGAQTIWNSDWDNETSVGPIPGNGFDSNLNCPTCHNVHGSRYNAMMRDGELTNITSATTGFDGLEYSFIKQLSVGSSTATVASSRGVSFGGVLRFAGAASARGTCITFAGAGCHDPSFGIAPSADFIFTDNNLIIPPGGTGSGNIIDYYRNPIPIPLSAVFTGSNTLTIAFSEPIQADVLDYANLVASVKGALTITPASATSSGNTITFNFTPAISADETGTLNILNSINDSYDFTAMTSSVFGQPIWDGQNP